MRSRRATCSLMAMLMSLSSCATYHAANIETDQAAEQATAAATMPSPPVVSSTDEPYLLGTPVAVDTAPPAILEQAITIIKAQPLPLTDIAGDITAITGIPVSVDSLGEGGGSATGLLGAGGSIGGLPPPPPALLQAATGSISNVPSVSVRYSGKLQGLLDDLVAQSGMSERFDNGEIKFFRIESKTFEIPAFQDVTGETSSIDASAGASSSSSGSSSSTGSSGSSTGETTLTDTSTSDIWAGLLKTGNAVAGGGTVVVDPASGTLTVSGTPDQVQQVSDWVDGEIQSMSKQVSIVIKIYNVQLNNESNYGFNPSVAFSNAAKSFGLTVGGASIPAVAGSATPASFAASVLSTATGGIGEFSGSTAAVQALASLGKVSQVFTRSIMTLNGQRAPLQSGEQTAYNAGGTQTSTASVGSTSTITLGNIPTGFTGSFLPRVIGDKIFIGMNITITSLVTIRSISSGTATAEAPKTTDLQVRQYAALKSGETLVVTGYQENDAGDTRNGVGSPSFALLGGGDDSTTSKNLVAIVVTASEL